MLTINHIDDNGFQLVQEATWVTFDPDAGLVHVRCEKDKDDYEITTGVVYVMNSIGKTITTYDLDTKNN